MNIVSAAIKSLLVLLFACTATAYAEEPAWPVEGLIDLSSGFCDFRPGHFHGGIDIRTGGKEGRKVFSPVDGYVWRLKYSYIGYGKGLYLKDTEGNIYVFGHLSRLSNNLEKTVKEYQYANRKYCFDRYFEPESLPVKKGELIAFSGQTGYGAPHIHFEKRTPDNLPLNPLVHGFSLSDDYAPEFDKAALMYFDDNTLFPDGKRRIELDVRHDKDNGRYLIDSVVMVQGPIAVAVKAFDRIRPRGPKLNLYSAKLYIDDYLYYENYFDKYSYDETMMVDLLFDYTQETNDDSFWHLMFNPPGKDYSGSKSLYSEGGVFAGQTQYGFGVHNARVEITDAAGNRTDLIFKFVYAPPDRLFETEWISDTLFYLHGKTDIQYLDIDRLLVQGKTGNGSWQKFASGLVEARGHNDFKVTVPRSNNEWKVLKVTLKGMSGWEYDALFMPLNVERTSPYSLKYSLEPDGLLFRIAARRHFVAAPRLEIVHEDGFVLDLPLKQISQNKFAAFYKCRNIASEIIRFDIYDAELIAPTKSYDVDIFPAGIALQPLECGVNGVFGVTADRNDFYRPTVIEVGLHNNWSPDKKHRIGAAYSVIPKTVPLAHDITVWFSGDYSSASRRVCIYRLNKKNEWKPLKTVRADGKLTAESSYMGQFAVLMDDEAPRVKNIHPRNNTTVNRALPGIRFTLSENLSGIEDDNNVAVYLDGEWLIPEYDPELELVTTSPRFELADGKHELKIVVSDRAENERIVHSEFFVNTKKKK
jgi:hypothetical protein